MSAARKIAWIGAIYLAVAIFTFGYAAAAADREWERTCATRELRGIAGSECFTEPAGSGFLAAIFWPLYWSWEAQS